MSVARNHKSQNGRRTLLAIGLVLAGAIVFVAMRVGGNKNTVELHANRASSESAREQELLAVIDPVQVRQAPHEGTVIPETVPAAASPTRSTFTSLLEDMEWDAIGNETESFPTATIHGRVRLANGSSSASVDVDVGWIGPITNGHNVFHGTARKKITVDADGSFTIPDLNLGSWSVRCSAPLCVSLARTIELKLPGEVAELDFELASKQVFQLSFADEAGRLLDEATEPALASHIAALRIVLTEVPLPPDGSKFDGRGMVAFKCRHVERDGTGARAQIESDRQGSVWCGVVLNDKMVASTAVPAGATAVTLRIARDRLYEAQCTLVVNVTSAETKLGVPGAVIHLTLEGGRELRCTCDKRGVFTATGLVPGQLAARVRAPDYLEEKGSSVLRSVEVNRLSFALRPSCSISGTCVDMTGLACAGLVIVTHRRNPSFSYRAEAGSDGRFRLDDLPLGEYLIRAVGTKSQSNVDNALKPLPRTGGQEGDCTSGSISGIFVVVDGP